MISTTTTLFSQRAEPSPLWSKGSPKRRITPVAVASRAIEASVMGEGEGSGGGDGGARGELSPVGGSKGREPLASPNVLHWVGWLPGTSRCGAGLAAPPRTARRSLPNDRASALSGRPVLDRDMPTGFPAGCQWAPKVAGSARCPTEGAERPEWGSGGTSPAPSLVVLVGWRKGPLRGVISVVQG